MISYLSLFLAGFIAATLFPASSEVLLYSLLNNGDDPIYLWIAATAGNTLGATINYFLGRYFLHFKNRQWFPVKADQLDKYQHWFQRYGVWSLLFSWLPIVGDGFTLIAGTMKVPFQLFVLLVVLGKGARYAAIIYAFGYLN